MRRDEAYTCTYCTSMRHVTKQRVVVVLTSSPQYKAVHGHRTGSNNSGVEYLVCMCLGVFGRYNAVRGRGLWSGRIPRIMY